jgi:hypothetical protein
MGARSPDEVKRELESERERLGDAVRTLRSGAETARRRLPLVALAATAAGFVVRTVAKRVFRRGSQGRDKRARIPFLGGD